MWLYMSDIAFVCLIYRNDGKPWYRFHNLIDKAPRELVISQPILSTLILRQETLTSGKRLEIFGKLKCRAFQKSNQIANKAVVKI